MAEVNIDILMGTKGAEITDAAVKRVTKSVKQLQDMTAKQFSVGFKAPQGMGGLFDVGAKGMKNLGNESEKANNKIKSTAGSFSLFGRVVAAGFLIGAAERVANLTDAFTNLQGKLATVGNTEGMVELATDRLAAVARRARADIESLATVYTRTTRAMTGYGKTASDITQFTETLAKAVKVGGSTNVEAANAMIQLSQGMSSGTLRGDELRSVMEQLPVVAHLIAKEFGVTTGELKKLGADGKLTTDRVFGAIIKGTDEVEIKFKDIRRNIADGWTAIKNSALLASEAFVESTGKISEAMLYLADNFDIVLKAAEALATMIGGALVVKLAAIAVANPFAALVIGAGAATAAVIAFADQIKVTEDGLVSLRGLAQQIFPQVKDGLTGWKDVVAELLPEWTKLFRILSFEEAANRAAFFADQIRLILNPLDLLKRGLLQLQAIMGNKVDNWDELWAEVNPNQAKMESTFANARTSAEAKAIRDKQVAIGEEKDKFWAEYLDTEKKFEEFLTRNSKPVAKDKKKGKGPSGLTPDDVIFNMRRNLRLERLEEINPEEVEYQKMLKQNVDMIGKGHKMSQEQLETIKQLTREQLGLNTAKEIEKKLAEGAKHDQEELLEAYKKTVEEEKQLVALRRTALDEAEERAADGLRTARGINDPNFDTKERIRDLENRRAEGMRLETMTPEEINEVTRAIENLKLSLTPGGTFVAEMNTMFGESGTLVSAMSSATASAILFADSWRDVKSIVNDVVNQITHQLVSSLIKLGINSALGLTPGGNVFGFASGGYTGNVGTDHVAGVVHGQEFVMNSTATRRFRPQLEAMNKGGSLGSVSQPIVNIHNNAGVAIESHTGPKGEIEITVNKQIAALVPKMIAREIDNASSKASRSLKTHLETGRRRT